MDTHNFKGLRDFEVERLADWCDSIMQTDQSCVLRDTLLKSRVWELICLLLHAESYGNAIWWRPDSYYATLRSLTWATHTCTAELCITLRALSVPIRLAREDCLRVRRPPEAAEWCEYKNHTYDQYLKVSRKERKARFFPHKCLVFTFSFYSGYLKALTIDDLKSV